MRTHNPFPLGPLSHLPHPTLLRHTDGWAELSMPYRRFPQAIYFTQGSNTSALLSQFILPSPSPPPCLQVCNLCLHLYSWAANRFIGTTFTGPIYIHVNIWSLLFSLWFTSFHTTDIRFIHIHPNDSISFLFMAIVLSCVWASMYMPAYIHLPCLFICRWTSKLLPCPGYCP